MTEDESRTPHLILAMILSALLIAFIAALTNSIDTQKFYWDFIFYRAMAQNGFNSPLASPFAYRYVTPLLVYEMTHFLGISLEDGFKSIAYLGAFLQLTGVFLFTHWLTRSIKGAYVALVATAFSLFNVKFLIFDVYRPDHLAYALMLLQTYFAFKQRFFPLLMTTLFATQIREFNLIPLLAYLFAFASRRDRPIFIRELVVSALGLALAIGLPRLLIPVTESFDFVELSPIGILRVLIAPLVLTRDFNFVFSVIAYLLPIFVLAGPREIVSTYKSLPDQVRAFLSGYIVLVLAFSFLGGTDFFRFSTFLFLPQAIMLGFLSQTSSNLKLIISGAAVFIFNRIWLPFPLSDLGAYLDFYGAYSTRFNGASIARLAECFAFIAFGFVARKLERSAHPEPPSLLQR
jgi:hypothetical protein